MQSGRDTGLLIGGPDGHSPEVLARADQKWALSKLTLPHALVRVFVAEQLFRAWGLLANHTYHRALARCPRASIRIPACRNVRRRIRLLVGRQTVVVADVASDKTSVIDLERLARGT